MNLPIPYSQSTIEYFHYLAAPGRTFIPYMEWRHQESVEIITDERTKALIKATGYPGDTDILDIIKWIEDNIEWLRRQIVGIPGTISDVVDGIIRDLGEWIKKVFQLVGNAIATLTASLYSFAKRFNDVLAKITTWISGLYKAIQQVVSNVVEKAAKWIENAIYAVKDWLDTVIKNVVSGFDATLSWINATLKPIIANIKSGIRSIADSIKEAFDASIRWVKNKIAAIVEKVNGAIKATGDWIKEIYDSITTTISNIITGIEEGFKTGLDAVISFLADLWERIKELIDDLFSLDLESLSAVFVKIFQAQAAAFEVMKAAAPA